MKEMIILYLAASFVVFLVKVCCVNDFFEKIENVPLKDLKVLNLRDGISIVEILFFPCLINLFL